MKRILSILIALLLLTPIINAETDPTSINLKNEIQEKLEAVDLEESSLHKLGFLLPIFIEIKSTDTDEIYHIKLTEENMILVDDPEKDPNLIIRATSNQLRDGFSKDDSFGNVISQFTFDPQSFKGSVLTIALEATYGKELLPDPTISQKILRTVGGWFV